MEQELIPGINKHRIEIVNSEDNEETCTTFVFHHEDHTLGNSLRYILMKNPEVEFCGYSVPHPSENKINLRLQTVRKPAVDVLKKGLEDLAAISEHVLETFQTAVSRFQNAQITNDEEMESDD